MQSLTGQIAFGKSRSYPEFLDKNNRKKSILFNGKVIQKWTHFSTRFIQILIFWYFLGSTGERIYMGGKENMRTSIFVNSVLRIRIRDPVPFWPLDPGSGMGRKSASGSGIRDEQPGSYFLELRNHFLIFFGLKYFNSLMRIRDPGWKKVGFGINIPDPQHCVNL